MFAITGSVSLLFPIISETYGTYISFLALFLINVISSYFCWTYVKIINITKI